MEPSPDAGQLRTRSACRWKAGVHENFLPLEVSVGRGTAFHAALRARGLGGAQLAVVDADAHRVMRTRALADRSEHGYLKLFWQIAGASRVEQAGRSSELRPGAWTFYDTARPYSIDIGDASRFAVMLLPFERCGDWNAVLANGLGQAFGSSGMSRAALGCALTALNDPDGYDAQSAEAMVTSIAGLMLAAARREKGAAHSASVHLLRAHRYIASHLDDPQLTPDGVAAALGVSRRTLYSWFEPLGQSPCVFIQRTRLDRCRSALLDPASRGTTITRIAFDHGFSDMAHFSRLFKGAFGASPREYRKRHDG